MAGKRSTPSTSVVESVAGASGDPAHTKRELRHDLGNALGALRLRVQLVLNDTTCRAAQAKNLEAIERILNRSIDLFTKLHLRAGREPVSPRPKSPRPRRRAKR